MKDVNFLHCVVTTSITVRLCLFCLIVTEGAWKRCWGGVQLKGHMTSDESIDNIPIMYVNLAKNVNLHLTSIALLSVLGEGSLTCGSL